MTPTNPTDALTNGQYEVDDYGSIGEAARRICCFCEGDMRRLVYITAKEELAATEARAQGLVEAERERCLEIAKNELIKCKKRTWGWYICWRIHEAIRSQHSQHGGERER